MENIVKQAYRMYLRNGTYYVQDNQTGQQKSLGTTDKNQAKRLLHAYNETRQSPAQNLEMAKVYLWGADPKLKTRTWQEVMDEFSTHGKESSQSRCKRAMASKPFNVIRNKPLNGTTIDDFKAVLQRGGNATNNYLRRLHNLAMRHRWLVRDIIPPMEWEKPAKRPKRGITLEEHSRIITAEANEERRKYYQLLWLVGSAQTDASQLTSENVNWDTRVLSYRRMKTGQWSSLQIGTSLETLLKTLPEQGFLFPKIATLTDNDRSAEFSRRCRLLGIVGVSLHSYRYAWAERAYQQGYQERFAQAALGHKSSAIHHAYARNAIVVCPALETIGTNIVTLSQQTTAQTELERKIG